MFRLDERVAIVTGSSRGIGRAIAQGFARAGAAVVVTSRTLEDAQKVAAEIEADGARARGVAFAAGDPDAIDALVDATVDGFGGIDVLVNNAAVLRPHVVDKVTEEELDELYRVNVKSPVLLSKRALPHLERSAGASIIHITALGGHAPMAGLGAYSASKAALLNWTRTMAKEWTPRGVRVNALTPGAVATDMILPVDPERRAKFHEDMASETLVGRIAEPDELVGPALFLASDASSYMTGQVLVVDGGMMA